MSTQYRVLSVLLVSSLPLLSTYDGVGARQVTLYRADVFEAIASRQRLNH